MATELADLQFNLSIMSITCRKLCFQHCNCNGKCFLVPSNTALCIIAYN